MNELVSISIPTPEPDAGGTVDLLELRGATLVVDSPNSYAAAGDIVQAARTRADELEAKRLELTRPLDKAKQTIKAFFDIPIGRLKTLETATAGRMLAYRTEQQRQQREAQQKLNDEAEAKRKRLAERAAAAEAKGNTAKAAELDRQAAEVTAPTVDTAPPKAAGIGVRTNWDFEVVDASLLAPEFLEPNMTAIGATVRSLKHRAEAFFKGALKVTPRDAATVRTGAR